MSYQQQQATSRTRTPAQGTLLGVVLDLSGSMYESMKNDEGNQYSRIESFSKTFHQVMTDAQLFLDRTRDKPVPFRLFMYGFGFLLEEVPTLSSSIGDILSIGTSLEEQVKRYQPLQAEIERIWLNEVEYILEERKITGDAKEELQIFVERELRTQAIQAEQQRSAAKFQRWCQSTCQKINAYDVRLRTHVMQYKRFIFLLLPLAISLLWMLRGPTLILTYLNTRFEAWVQHKLADMRMNADTYATQQAEKVVVITKKALTDYHNSLSTAIEQEMLSFLDREANKFIRLYNTGSSSAQRQRAFDRSSLKRVYDNVAKQMSDIMSPHADGAWKRSVFLLKQAANALKIKPDWDLLREKTIRCAHQIVWETMAPEVRSQAKSLAKERFTRAALTTIVQKTKDKESTLSLQEVSQFLNSQEMKNISLRELPIFGQSPIGFALNQTFTRLRREASRAQNTGLRPAILLISDGMPTDKTLIDTGNLAEKIKRMGIPIVSCYVTNKNVGRSWVLRNHPGWFWSEPAHFMYSIASYVDEWPQFGQQLMESRFTVKKQAKLFIQINHTAYLRNFIEAILLPVGREQREQAK